MVIALFRRYGKVYGVVTRSKTFTAEKPWAILQFTVRFLTSRQHSMR